jgi:hypothetical protein
MNISFDWTISISTIVNFLVAVGTIGLAFFAWKTIRDIKIQNKRKELEKIMDWAMEFLRCRTTRREVNSRFDEEAAWSEEMKQYMILINSLKLLRINEVAIKQSVALVNEPTLTTYVNKLSEQIPKYSDFVTDAFNAIPDDLKNVRGSEIDMFISLNNKLSDFTRGLSEYVDSVVDEITKIMKKS